MTSGAATGCVPGAAEDALAPGAVPAAAALLAGNRDRSRFTKSIAESPGGDKGVSTASLPALLGDNGAAPNLGDPGATRSCRETVEASIGATTEELEAARFSGG